MSTQMPFQTKKVPPRFERLLFWLRWPYWALVVAVALRDRGDVIAPMTLFSLVLGAAALNLTLYALLQFNIAREVTVPLFSGLDVIVMAGLLLAAGTWPTPLYPLAIFPIVMVALRWGAPSGASAGTLLALIGLGTFLLQSAEQVAASFWLAELVALISLPLIGASVGLGVRHTASDQLHSLAAEAQELRFARDRSDAVYAMASTLGATLDFRRVLETLFDVSAIEFRAIGLDPREMVGIALLFEERSHDPPLQVVGGHNLKEEDWNLRCPAKVGLLANILHSKQAMVVSDVASDPELKQFKSLANAQSAILAPLNAGFDSYGLIMFASRRADAYDLDRCHFLTAFTSQLTIALQNARLFQSLRDERDRIIDQQEEARRQIARELHDGPTQTIAALAMRLNYARLLLRHDPDKASKELSELEDLARRTTKEIRTMLFALRPVVLETQGLAAALRQYGQRLQETDGLVVTVNDSRFKSSLSDDTAGVIFSILEEAINNARKHAQTRDVVVTLQTEGNMIVAEVRDSGIGFDLPNVEQTYDQRGSLGLLNMRERAELIDGNLTVKSEPGHGTTVTLVAPAERAANTKSRRRQDQAQG